MGTYSGASPREGADEGRECLRWHRESIERRSLPRSVEEKLAIVSRCRRATIASLERISMSKVDASIKAIITHCLCQRQILADNGRSVQSLSRGHRLSCS